MKDGTLNPHPAVSFVWNQPTGCAELEHLGSNRSRVLTRVKQVICQKHVTLTDPGKLLPSWYPVGWLHSLEDVKICLKVISKFKAHILNICASFEKR